MSDDAPPPEGERRRRRRRRRPGDRDPDAGPRTSDQPQPQAQPPPQPQPPRPQPRDQRPPRSDAPRPQRSWHRQAAPKPEARSPKPEAQPRRSAEIPAADVPIEPDRTWDGPLPTVFDRRAEVRTTAELSIPDHDELGDTASGQRVVYGFDDDGPPKDVSFASELPADPPPGDLDPLTADLEDSADLHVDVANLVGVRLAAGGRVYLCDAGEASYDRGDEVVVDTERGPRLGVVALPSQRRPTRDKQLRRVLRRPHEGDRKADADAGAAARDALRLAKDKAKQLDLPIKVFRVERQGGRLLLYFTSDERIDVRDLVREVGNATGARIELRQIGVRDEAKMVGGIGSCGQELCCTTWLPEFVPVSIKMAKDQGLVLNPTKVSGQCGRLKCCLVYEQATYAEMRKGLPKLGKRVITPTGEGRVVEVDVLRQRIRVSTGPGESTVYAAGDVKPMFPPQTQGRAPESEPDDSDPNDSPDEPSS